MRKRMILIGGFIVMTTLLASLCFGNDKSTTIEVVRKVKKISELRNYLGIDDEHKTIKLTILDKLDEFEDEEDESEKVEILYLLYIQEETPENDKIQSIGGQGPPHIWIQNGVLYKLAKSPLIDKSKKRVLVKEIPLKKSKKRILDIVNTYITSVNEMDYQKWRLSPKQSLVIGIAFLLGNYLEDEDIRDMAYRYLASNNIKEQAYAMPYLETPLLEYKLSKVPKEEDLRNDRRIKMVLDVASKPKLRDMLSCPRRLFDCAKILEKVLENDISNLDAFMESNPKLNEPTKYFLHYFRMRYLLEEQKKGLQISSKETNEIKKAVDFWTKNYSDVFAELKYGDDVLYETISELVEKINNKTLKKKIEDCKRKKED